MSVGALLVTNGVELGGLLGFSVWGFRVAFPPVDGSVGLSVAFCPSTTNGSCVGTIDGEGEGSNVSVGLSVAFCPSTTNELGGT